MTTRSLPPEAAGLYDPRFEHDACGVAMVARLDNQPTHEVVQRALEALDNLEHRGAEGADVKTGDGAGILTQIPHDFFRSEVDFELPARGQYGVGVCFLPQDPDLRRKLEQLLELNVRVEGQIVLGWREVPVDEEHVGETANRSRPHIKQLFIEAGPGYRHDQDAFERKLYVIRRIVELAAGPDFYASSFSSRTIVYKGMLISTQLRRFFADLSDERFASAMALVHSRFSTNTFPSWELAHPFRVIAHNGEINTLMGNKNWMRARESQLASELFGLDLQKIMPIVRNGGSDSDTFDNVLELLMLAGRSLPHSAMMMIPEAYTGRADLSEELKGFYAFHSCFMEPWDGPAAVCFTDGRVIGATLDRNGLRPGRWIETTDGHVILGSEAGMLAVRPENIVRLGRLAPGKLFLVDLEKGCIVADEDVKHEVATRKPYGKWYAEQVVHFDDLPVKEPIGPRTEPLRTRQLAFGYTQEDERVLLAPMAAKGEEPIGSMGNDNALAVLSDQSPPLFSYFKQLFAQVTNPPIDSIREAVVMSLATGIGAEGNLFDEAPEHARQLAMDQPILRNHELETLRQIDHPSFKAHTIDITWPVEEGPEGLRTRLANACDEAYDAVFAGYNIVILSDRNVSASRAPIPSLLATGAIHHHLVREGNRLQAGLVVESGEPREVHHFATLIGYGASAVNPYLMFEALAELEADGRLPEVASLEQAEKHVVKAIGKGLLKTISKMGISTTQSYCGAQIFEAVGLDRSVVERHFTGTASRIGGIGMPVIGEEALKRHARGYPRDTSGDLLPVGGVYAWRRDGEHHQWNPETIALLQHATRSADGDAESKYAQFAELVNEDATRRATLRGLLEFRTPQQSIPIEEVEPAKEIVKRFATGAMSLGSISTEAHETLAVAMNRLGGRSNTGEGGEDPRRFTPDENGDLRRSSIKQVASGRFGVTAHYLVNADQLQIKMAQGAKPGEGGQLPGHKVDKYIGSVRHTTPGVSLISPPPHHDIYSIEDLKQLIYDLRCANPKAQVSVKLVAEVGVGTVAAGVAKANADHVVIAGHDGGTGASPLSSVQAAGVPWEIGLAETQQTLLLNDLRSRILVQTDGQLKTGRDVVMAAMLGADEMGFSTAPLIATGCIMMRACHLNTCPVGIATQDPELRKRFQGEPEHVVNYFFLVAEEVRAIMAELGVARFEELIGRVDLLEGDKAIEHWKARGVDVSHLLHRPELPEGTVLHRTQPPPPVLDDALDHELILLTEPAIERGEHVAIETEVRNVNRCVGGMLSSKIAEVIGADGLPEGTIEVTFRGSAGQSFGGWLAAGVSFALHGDANDYTGKGLSGGVLSVQPSDGVTFAAEENVIVGNTVLYGATSGRAFFCGQAGERFGVRNSGASAVVEGVGDHGCEYMTGGRVVVLGRTGRNFAAGMSGGIAYVLDEHGALRDKLNPAMLDQLEELDDVDAQECFELVSEHTRRTGSEKGAAVLADWERARSAFVKVFPADYKRVLEELAAEAGDDTEAPDADEFEEQAVDVVGAPAARTGDGE
ncbi:MAG: Glutamate synthase [NADPH] large chain [uncultured Solirubrobacteraceae bacterium]|uniref:Glutamate synthase [NADPH] large chain n=1 Tax=uncultured Solirubrobacteraceae bacterium TaxID=1162706 RepID=A0A6J4S9B5_9ACTN|nr:MAG: Glutamate synthase [NADPH] large chain [uncultured Solirubrobacteraceae bacterium]